MQQLIAEAKSRGVTELTVLYELGDASPEEFFNHMGFVPTGETEYGEVIATHVISSATV